MTNNQTGNRAVVLGGSMAGTLAARVLAESYAEVLVVDRDEVLGVDTPRRGAPHTIHAHALHARGHLILEEMFPGLTDGLTAAGVPSCDLGEMHWYLNARRLKPARTGLISVLAPRPMLEEHIRRRVAALPNVTFRQRHDILELVPSQDRTRITGVKIEARDGGTGEETLSADLVVDTTGRGSRTPAWLEEFGYRRPEEDRVKIGLAYTTRQYELTDDLLRGIPSINPIASPAHPRGAFFGLSGPDLANLSLTGILGDHPPTDPAGFLEFVRSLPIPDVYDAIIGAKPVNDPVTFRFPASVRRRYERLPAFPDGLLVLGDAVCSFNPVYGQGMTVAAMEADALRQQLRRDGNPRPAEYFAEIGRIIDMPWEVSVNGDLDFPGVEGHRSIKVRAGNAYMARLQYAATKDPKVTEGFMRVAGLLDPPQTLMRPRMLARVLRHAVRRPAPGTSWLEHEPSSAVGAGPLA